MNKKITLLNYCLDFLQLLIVPYRCESPPVPTVRNRLLQVQQRQLQNSHLVEPEQHGGGEASQAEPQQRRPPSAQFVPYVRTREVFCLQPEAPLSQHPQLHGSETLHYSHFHGSQFPICFLLNCASLWVTAVHRKPNYARY